MGYTWAEENCSKCGKINWISLGDTDDCTGQEYDGYKCWNCGKVQYWEGMSLEEVKAEFMYEHDGDLNIADGFEKP